MKFVYTYLFLFFYVIYLFGQELFPDSKVIKIELSFSQPDYWQLLQQNKESKIDIPAKLIINDTETFDSVGVRFKGNSSYSMSNDKKKPFNISMDAFIDGQDLWGVETFNLGNAFMDPTYVREKITYNIFRKYMPAGKCGYVRLYINREYWGLYVNVEQVNKDFLKNWFSSDEGNLYKGDPKGTLVWMHDDLNAMKRDYEKKTNKTEDDWSDLVHLTEILNTSNDLTNELPEVLNVDRAIWYLAICNILVNLDSYIYEGHNYYIYNNPSSQQFNMIPWDLNESFGCFPDNQLSLKELEEYRVFNNLDNPNLPLISRMIENNHFRAVYLAHYRTLLNNEFNPDSVLSRINYLHSLIDEYVQSDLNKLYPYQFFIENVENNVIIQNHRNAPGIMTLIKNRKDYLLNDPDLKRASPEIKSVQCLPETLHAANDAVFKAEVSGQNGIEWVRLFFRIGEAHFASVLMLDDGQHNDNSSGDNTFGCSIQIPENSAGNRIHYYILAVNQQGDMKFYPEQAEFVTLSAYIKTGLNLSDLVINEFMAGNSLTIHDQQDEYEDWIELYNRSSETISVNGMYLTDDLAEPKKWELPDTFIEAHGYLIIWADNDSEDQPGLHANFKLNKSGESIGLYDTDENDNKLIDCYIFEQQEDDISTGRYANGEGDFLQMSPTPGTENQSGIGIMAKNCILSKKCILFSNYPNPFFSQTFINYSVSAKSFISLNIYNCKGKLVRNIVNKIHSPGKYTVSWDGKNCQGLKMASGLYLYRLSTNNSVSQKRMFLVN